MTSKPHILVVDDHCEIRQSVTRYLERNGLRTSMAADASEMDAALGARDIDLVVLDVMMPGEDGLSACARLRASGNGLPILMLTARDAEEDLIQALDTGADDYLAKPFNPRELLARIHAILRRAGTARPRLAGRRVAFCGVHFDIDARTIRRADGRHEDLTSGEVKLLTILVERAREVLSREDLLTLATGRLPGPMDRTIDNQVSRLRKKLEPDPLRPRIITTIRNGGYVLACDVEELE